MKYAVIDIGSNTIRLCVYEVNGKEMTELFHSKLVAGLISYVEDGVLSDEGIQVACESLEKLKEILSFLQIQNIFPYGTAVLRNIENTDQVIKTVEEKTGMKIDLLTGTQEAMLGYYGIFSKENTSPGNLIDIGGGSTEITCFTQSGPQIFSSISLGSLNLYTKCCGKHIIPGKKERSEMKTLIETSFSKKEMKGYLKGVPMYAIGGSARAVLKLANYFMKLDSENTQISRNQLLSLQKLLFHSDSVRNEAILRICPDRVHTVIPGLMILTYLVKKLDAPAVTVSECGVREGYLKKRILNGEESLR